MINKLAESFLFILFCLTYFIGHYYGFNIYIIIILLIYIVGMIYFEYKSTKSIIAPKILWIICWLLVIVIARLGGMYIYITPWSNELNKYVILNTMCFFFIYDITEKLAHIARNKSRNIHSIDYYDKKINYKVIYYVSIILLIISILCFWLNVLKFRYIPAFKTDDDSYRIAFRETTLNVLFNIGRITCSLVPLLRNKVSKKYYNISILLIIIYLICSFLTGWRATMFQGIIMYVTTEFILNIKTTNMIDALKKSWKYIILVIGVFVIVAIQRSLSKGGNYINVLSFGLFMIYMYIAPQFINFETGLMTIIPNYNLVQTTEGLWSMLFDHSYFQSYQKIYIVMKGGYNVSTYLLLPYVDGGIFGTLFWTAAIAFVAAVSFEVARDRKSIIAFPILSITNMLIFSMHSGFVFASSVCYVWIFLSFIISKIIYKKGKKKYSISLNGGIGNGDNKVTN